MRLLRNKKGMTLVEAGMAITIISIVSTGLLLLLSACIVGWHNGTAQDTATSEATIAAQKLLSEIRDGKSASISSGILVVVYPKSIQDPITKEVTYDISGSDPLAHYFYIKNGNLMKRIGSTGAEVILERGVEFKKDANNLPMIGADKGEVNVTLLSKPTVGATTQKNVRKPPQQEVTLRITLRNYRSLTGS